jgi:hypothetical protein
MVGSDLDGLRPGNCRIIGAGTKANNAYPPVLLIPLCPLALSSKGFPGTKLD